MRVIELWRHPVKSLQGEPLSRAELEANGLLGDRSWGIVDHDTGKVLTARREPLLLLASARLDADGTPALDLPNGDHVEGPGDAADVRLSKWLGRPVRLVNAQATNAGVAEYFEDSTDDTSRVLEWRMPSGRFVDACPLLVVTTASLRRAAALYPDGAWSTRRLRPNIVVDVDGEGWVEDAWCQREVRIGESTIVPLAPCERCTMVTRPQPGLDRDLDVFRTLARHHNATFGVWARVASPGTIHINDVVAIG